MDKAQIEEMVRGILMDRFSIGANMITMDSSFENDLGMDSLGVVELQMLLEEKLRINIDDDDMNGLRTVKDVVEYLGGMELSKV